MRIIMSNEEKKERMARNYAINSKKTPRTRRMAFAITERLTLLSSDQKFAFYRSQGLDLIEY